MTAVTFGMEEEYVLLDPASLRPVDLGSHAVDELTDAGPGAVVREFFPSQVEFATPICRTSADGLDAVAAFRRRLAEWAADHRVIAAATGTPFATDGRVRALEGRYAVIADDIAGLTAEHQLNGLHVHVAIPDRDRGVRASNFLRPWLPVLLALSANSPFWLGSDTGYASWRAIHSRRWTTHGIPPFFGDAAEHDDAVARLVGVGATSDAGTINWHTRLSAAHPTTEVRACDVQLDPVSAVALATIVRALVVEGFGVETARPQRFEGWDAALWHAARHGVTATLVHPESGRLAPASVVVDAVYDRVRRHLDHADARLVKGFLTALGRSGTGASLQRRAHRRDALATLYRERMLAR